MARSLLQDSNQGPQIAGEKFGVLALAHSHSSESYQ